MPEQEKSELKLRNELHEALTKVFAAKIGTGNGGWNLADHVMRSLTRQEVKFYHSRFTAPTGDM